MSGKLKPVEEVADAVGSEFTCWGCDTSNAEHRESAAALILAYVKEACAPLLEALEDTLTVLEADYSDVGQKRRGEDLYRLSLRVIAALAQAKEQGWA